MNGNILTLDNKLATVFSKDYTTLMQVITDMYGGEEENETNS